LYFTTNPSANPVVTGSVENVVPFALKIVTVCVADPPPPQTYTFPDESHATPPAPTLVADPIRAIHCTVPAVLYFTTIASASPAFAMAPKEVPSALKAVDPLRQLPTAYIASSGPHVIALKALPPDVVVATRAIH
jgi:hypothetical protein